MLHVAEPADGRPAFDYRFQDCVCSSLYTQAYGPEIEATLRDFCAAVLAGEDSFACPSTEYLDFLYLKKDDVLPLAVYAVLESGYDDPLPDGRCRLSYTLPREEYLAEAEAFEARIAELIAEADLREGDSDLEKAMKLYTATSLRIGYDYAAAEGDVPYALSPYRCLMEDSGICQEIAPAYAYLLLQVGVDAGICGSLAKDGSFAHAWTLVKLDGQWYHADVTWQLDQPYRLQYFLNTDAMRDLYGLDVDGFNVGEFNELWHDDLPIDDERYARLWDLCWYAIDHENGCLEYYDDPELDYYDLSLYDEQPRETMQLP